MEKPQSVTRINEFLAAEGKAEALGAFMQGVVNIVLKAPGCLDCRLLRHHEDGSRFAVIETWESIEAHQAAAKLIPAEMMAQVMPLLAAKPKGDYFLALI